MQKLSKNVPVKMTMEFWQKTRFICNNTPAGKEWSAILFYKYDINKKITDPGFEIELVDLFLMDIGTEGFTSYVTDVTHVHYMVQKGYLQGYGRGTIHSHHNMDTFFSGTDDDDLKTNSSQYNFYVSIITNNKDQWKGKIGMASRVESSYNLRDGRGNPYIFNTIDTSNLYADCNILFPFTVPEDTAERLNTILEEYKAKSAKKPATQQTIRGFDYADDFASSDAFSWATQKSPIILSKDIKDFIDPSHKSLESALKNGKLEGEALDVVDDFISHIEKVNRCILSLDQEIKAVESAKSLLETLSVKSELKTRLIKMLKEGIKFRKESILK